MDITKRIMSISVYALFFASNPAWAVVRTEPSKGASYLFIVVAVLGGVIAILGIILAFRGVTSPADVSIKIPGAGKFKFNKVSQGVVLAVIAAAILISTLYLYPTTNTEIVTETTTIENEDGTRTIHRREAF